MLKRKRTASTAIQAPHSWDIEHWPKEVYPHSEGRARYLLRAHRDELLKAGALARVGRELVVIGARYTRWLQLQASNVPEYASNVPQVTAPTPPQTPESPSLLENLGAPGA